jgi:hypothetical protein
VFLHRTSRLLLSLFLGVWLVVVVPAHRVIDELLDGHSDVRAGGNGGASGAAAARTAHETLGDAPSLHGHDDAHCAICLYAIGLTVATPQTIAIAPPQLRAIRAERAPPAAVIATLPTPIRGRAPPAC